MKTPILLLVCLLVPGLQAQQLGTPPPTPVESGFHTDKPLSGDINADFGFGQDSSSPTPVEAARAPAPTGEYKIVSVTGAVETASSDSRWDRVSSGGSIAAGNSIWVPAGATLVVQTPTGDTLTFREGARATLPALGDGVALKEGTVDASGSRLSVNSPTATVSARGTKYRVNFDRQKQGTRIDVQEGEVQVAPKNSSLAPRILSAGQWCIVYPDRIEPADAGRAADASKSRGLSIEQRTARSGTQITLPVLLHNITADAAAGLGNINFELTYNPAVVSLEGKISRGNIYGSDVLFETNTKEIGRIRIAFAGSRGITQSGTVAQIPFKVIGQPGQQTDLSFKILQAQTPNGQSATVPTSNGRITIPAATAQPYQTTSEPTSGHIGPDGRATSQRDGTSGHVGATAASSSGAKGTGPGGACGLAGEWEYKVNNTVSKWILKPNDKGGYDADQIGYGQVTGPASIKGVKLRIDWRGYTNTGFNEYDISSDCSSGTGKSVVHGGDFAGEYPSTIRRLTVAPEYRAVAAAKAPGGTAPPAAHSSPAAKPPVATPAGAPASAAAAAAQLRNPDGTTMGDCNGDGKLTSMDAECALQMSVGARPPDLNLDLDKDGQVLSADARRILQEATRMMGR